MSDTRKEATMEQEATDWATRLHERCKPFVDGEVDPFDNDDERASDLPECYGFDLKILIHCYGGGPAGGVEFDVQRGDYGQLEFRAARTWHQDWYQPKGYAALDDETGEFLFNLWAIESVLDRSY